MITSNIQRKNCKVKSLLQGINVALVLSCVCMCVMNKKCFECENDWHGTTMHLLLQQQQQHEREKQFSKSGIFYSSHLEYNCESSKSLWNFFPLIFPVNYYYLLCIVVRMCECEQLPSYSKKGLQKYISSQFFSFLLNWKKRLLSLFVRRQGKGIA